MALMEWTAEPIRAFRAGVNDPENRTVCGDAGAIAHILRHQTFLKPEWILQAIREPDEIWTHPDPRKLAYKCMIENDFGQPVTVVVIVKKTTSVWEVQTAFDLWPEADWSKIGKVMVWRHG
jgi:hypothetical protein